MPPTRLVTSTVTAKVWFPWQMLAGKDCTTYLLVGANGSAARRYARRYSYTPLMMVSRSPIAWTPRRSRPLCSMPSKLCSRTFSASKRSAYTCQATQWVSGGFRKIVVEKPSLLDTDKSTNMGARQTINVTFMLCEGRTHSMHMAQACRRVSLL